MPEQIECPNCGGCDIEEIPFKAAVGASPSGKYPSEAEYAKYRCRLCTHEFFEGDLLDQPD